MRRPPPDRNEEADADSRRRLLAILEKTVRFRFVLDAGAFADRIVALARRGPADPPLPEHAQRLSLDDLYLATACAQAEEAAWRECAQRHFTFIRDFARRYLADVDARDLADQLIADLWQRGKIASYEGRSSLRTWLGALVVRGALNVRKSRRTSAAHVGSDPRYRPGTIPHAEATEPTTSSGFGAIVTEALCGRSAEDRLLLLLHYEQGLTLDEIGVAVCSSKSTLSRRLKRVRGEIHAAIDAIARRRLGVDAAAARQGVDFGRLDLDLEAVLRSAAKRDSADTV